MESRERIGPIGQQARRFYDGGTLPRDSRPGEPADPSADPRIVLERHAEEGVETFALERRLAYLDRHLGELLVPADPAFRTDLTSVPALFTWLVPKTGAHLPAALLHDALVAGRDDPASYVSTEGHMVDRVQADRIFRDSSPVTAPRATSSTGRGWVRSTCRGWATDPGGPRSREVSQGPSSYRLP